MEKWRGKIAIVTGGSSGIGAAVAEMLLSHEFKVIVLDKALCESKNFRFYQCDISSQDSINEVFEKIEEEFNFVHILVNCAGICHFGAMLNESAATTKSINSTLGTNIFGTVHVTRAAYRLMKKSNEHGFIINIASIVAHHISFAHSNNMIYPATKHAIKAFSESLRQELILSGDEKVRVSNLSPGAVASNLVMNSNLPKEKIKEMFLKSGGEFPRTVLKPKDIADCIEYLLSTPCNVNITELTVRPVGEKV